MNSRCSSASQLRFDCISGSSSDEHRPARIARGAAGDRVILIAEVDRGKIVIAAGFQGVDDDFNITTLGRGGSDTTATALAAVLQAEECEIYTDVEGIFTTDPLAKAWFAK